MNSWQILVGFAERVLLVYFSAGRQTCVFSFSITLRIVTRLKRLLLTEVFTGF